MFSKKFLTISDFAKISGVSRQTLIYYDRIGLFSPAFVANNKYRMYSHNQVDNIGIITILSDLGVPLKKIKEILADISIETIYTTLKYQINAIDEKIEKLTVLKEMTQIRLEQIEEGKRYLNGDTEFFIRELSEDIPIRIGDEINRPQEDIGDETISAFFDCIEQSGLPLIFSFGYIKNAEDVLQNTDGIISRMWFRLKDKKSANSFIPKGKYLIGYGKGDYGKTNYIYKELLHYAERNGLAITGNVYEEYLIDELSEKNPDNFVLQIRVRIRS